MVNIELNTLKLLCPDFSLKQRMDFDLEKSSLFSWIPALNEKVFCDRYVPSLFYRVDKELIELNEEYAFVTENRRLLKGLKFQGYKERALWKLFGKMTQKWLEYYSGEIFNTSDCRFKSVREKLRYFGAAYYETTNTCGAITDPFRRLIQETNPESHRQF